MKIAIIGAGITGLTAAYTLAKHGHSVTVFEKEETAGGLAGGFKGNEWQWPLEKTYHHFFTNDKALLSLVNELGLDDDIIVRRPITATLFQNIERSAVSEKNCADRFPSLTNQKNDPRKDKITTDQLNCIESIASSGANNFFCEPQRSSGQIFQLDSPISLLTFPYLSPLDKLRTAAILAFCKLNPFWQPLEHRTAKEFFSAWGGRSSWNVLWEPLMTGKFGPYANDVAASWLWARIKKRTPCLGYLEGSFQTLIDAFDQAITRYGGTIFTNTSVSSVQKSTNDTSTNLRIEFQNHSSRIIHHSSFDRVLLTIPTTVAINLFPHSSSIVHHSSLSIPHLHAQTLILETREPILKNIYWLNIADRSFPFLAVVAHTNFMDKKNYGGRHLTYLGNYLPQGHPYLTMESMELYKIFMPFIITLSPQFRQQCNNVTMKQLHLFTGTFAQPVHLLHYSKRAPKLQTPTPGVYLANLDSIYPWDRGINYSIELGQRAASLIMQKVK